jgi:hypothetical protein
MAVSASRSKSETRNVIHYLGFRIKTGVRRSCVFLNPAAPANPFTIDP